MMKEGGVFDAANGQVVWYAGLAQRVRAEGEVPRLKAHAFILQTQLTSIVFNNCPFSSLEQKV